jgi:predicted phosphodiesterase
VARVLVISDTHCPGMRAGYVDFLKRVADDYAVTRVVHIGDLVDWASISYHEKSPSLRNATQEYAKARKQVAALARAFPKADWLIGNHDALTERQAVTAGLPPELLRDYADMWDVGWTVHPRFSKLLIDGVVYSHGDSGRGGQDAAFQQAKDNFRSTVIGHFHNQASVRWCPPRAVCGCARLRRAPRLRCETTGSRAVPWFEYGRRFAHKPILGCGVVLNGKQTYFEPWLLRSR